MTALVHVFRALGVEDRARAACVSKVVTGPIALGSPGECGSPIDAMGASPCRSSAPARHARKLRLPVCTVVLLSYCCLAHTHHTPRNRVNWDLQRCLGSGQRQQCQRL